MPQAVYVGLGVWEALWNSKTSHAPSKEYAARLDSGLAQISRLRDMLSAQSLLFILGNGGCRNQQPQWRHLMGPKTDFPGVEFERQVVVQGNAILEAFARNESAARGGGVLYLDRSATMHGAKYMDTVSSLQSPCFHFHPYGVLTDVHVTLGLEALASYTLGGQGQDRQSRGRQGKGRQGYEAGLGQDGDTATQPRPHPLAGNKTETLDNSNGESNTRE